jgi:hypothetical protein
MSPMPWRSPTSAPPAAVPAELAFPAEPDSPDLPALDRQPGRPPVLAVETPVDPTRWATEHRAGLRAVVAEHGSVLVRGLGLRDATEVGASSAAWRRR